MAEGDLNEMRRVPASIRAGAIVESTISLEIVPGERLVAHGWVTALVPA